MRVVSAAILVSLSVVSWSAGAFAQDLKTGNGSGALMALGAQAPSSLAASASGPSSAVTPDQFGATATRLSMAASSSIQVALGSVTAPQAITQQPGTLATPSAVDSASLSFSTAAGAGPGSASLSAVANTASVEPPAVSSMAGMQTSSEAKDRMSGVASVGTPPTLKR
jgi:hypothetical protein